MSTPIIPLARKEPKSADKFRLLFTATLAFFLAAGPLRAADPLVDGAVAALAHLTDPHRLENLPEPAFRAQLGPALGWLHVARRRDVAPEAVIGRAFALNGLDGSERARLTREALLRNLALADAWELFTREDSARALADGRPAQILAGIHRGHLAETAVIVPAGLGPQDRRSFACLALRPDDEMPSALPSQPAPRKGRSARQPGDLVARRSPRPAASPAVAPIVAAQPVVYDDALPIAYTALGSDAGAAINVRVEAHPGQPVDLEGFGGPPMRFLLRGVDAAGVHFSLLAGQTLTSDAPVQTAAPEPDNLVYERAGVMRITLCAQSTLGSDGSRLFLFEFPTHPPGRPR